MPKIRHRDLTQGNVTKNLIIMSIPTMFGFFAQTLYDFIDMIWIGKISAQAVAGMAIFSTLFWTADIFNEIIGISSISLISQNYGSGKKDKARQVIEQAISYKFLVSVLMAIIFILLLDPISYFFTHDAEVIKNIQSYGYIRSLFLPFMFSSFSVNTALRCIGDARTPMIIMMLTALLNIILDPLLMFEQIPGTSIPGLGLGIQGAAIATVISTFLAFAIGIFILLTGQSYLQISFTGLFQLSKNNIKKLSTIGLPTGMEMFFRQGGQFILLKFISLYGTAALATFGIGMRLFNLVFLPLLGLALGGSAVTGQNLGANQIGRTRQAARSAVFLGIVATGIITIIAVIFPEQVIHLFIKQTNVVSIGKQMIYIISPSFIAVAISMGLNTVFAGSGYNLPYLIASITSRWLFQIPFSAFVVYIFEFDIQFIWIGFLIAEFIELSVIIFYYHQGNWKTNRV